MSSVTPSSSVANSSRLVIAALFLGALWLRLAGVARAVWLDEALTLRWVHAAGWRAWLTAVRDDLVPPAYPLLLTAWASVSDSVLWLRLLSVACGLGTVGLGMRWAAATSRRAGLAAALLLSSAPLLLRYGVELRAYSLVGFASVWAGCAAWRVASSPVVRGRDTASLLLALLLASWTHFTAVLLVPAAVALILIGACDRPVARVPWMGIAGVCAAWAVVVVASNAHGTVAGDFWMPALTPRLAWLSFGEVLGVAGPGIGMPPVAQAAWVLLLLALGAVFALAEPSRAWTAPLGAAVTYWVCLAAASVAWRPLWWPRTMLAGLVLLLVSVAIASTRLRTARLRTVAAFVIVLLSLFGAARWTGGAARRSLEPWDRVVAELPPASAAGSVFVVPDYAVAPFLEGRGGQRQRVTALRLDGRGNRDRMADVASAAGADRTLTLVVRIDLTVTTSLDGLASVLTQLAEFRGTAPVRVLLVMSPDASLAPELFETRARVEASATRLFGPVTERREASDLTSLTFASRR